MPVNRGERRSKNAPTPFSVIRREPTFGERDDTRLEMTVAITRTRTVDQLLGMGDRQRTRRSAICDPTWVGSNQVPAPMSGIRPRWTKIQEKRAREPAIRRSAWAASSTPSPAAGPSIAAMTGLTASHRNQ